MELSTTLQILNVILLALFGTAGWRMVDEWRKSREERHQAELALLEKQTELCKGSIESLKTTHKHELENRDIQITRLKDENARLLQKRDDRTSLLEQQIEFLKAQAPAGVSANFDALKKWYAEQLSIHEGKVEKSQSTLSEEKLKHEAAIQSKDIEIERLKIVVKESITSVASKIGLRNLLAPPNALQDENVERARQEARNASGAATPYSVRVLIRALGHWDLAVRETAAQGLMAQGGQAVPRLVAELKGNTIIDLILWLVGRTLSGYIERLVAIIEVLTSIGNPTLNELEGVLLRKQGRPQVRALMVLRGINTEEANKVLERNRHIVNKWIGITSI